MTKKVNCGQKKVGRAEEMEAKQEKN